MNWEAETFEELFEEAKKGIKGSFYERMKGLKPRCFYGKKQRDDFGTITYVTDDGRVALLFAYSFGGLWRLWYPSESQFDYFINSFPEHIKALYTNNLKDYKLVRKALSPKEEVLRN